MGDGPIPVLRNKPNANVSIAIDEKDLSIGQARYRACKVISRNLCMKRGGRAGDPDRPMVHSSVEVHLHNDQGAEVPMTRRLIRTWDVRPLPGATVDDLGKWQIVGMAYSECSPFAPSGGEPPGQLSFVWDRPGARDAPALHDTSGTPFGLLQEFIAGDAKVGGVYYQIYTLTDTRNTRVITTNELTFSAADFRDILKMIDSGQYAKSMSSNLFFGSSGKSSTVTPLPPR